MSVISYVWGYRSSRPLTTSVKVLGRLEMYKFVEPSSPSALRRELKDSWSGISTKVADVSKLSLYIPGQSPLRSQVGETLEYTFQSPEN